MKSGGWGLRSRTGSFASLATRQSAAGGRAAQPGARLFPPLGIAQRPPTSAAWRTEAARLPPSSASPGCLPSQICSHRFLPGGGGSVTCPSDTGRSGDTDDTVSAGVRVVPDESAELSGSSRWPLRLGICRGAAMDAVSTATAFASWQRPGRNWMSRGRASEWKLTSGSRRSGLSRGGGDPRLTGMINKAPKLDLGLEFPEKKKKKKKKLVKEAETRYSVLSIDPCFVAASPRRSGAQGQAPEVPLVVKKKKKKKKSQNSALGEEPPEPELSSRAQRTKKSPSPRKQSPSHSEFLGGEKKKKRKSVVPLAVPHGLRVKVSPDPRQGEEVSRASKKPKKHKKEKKAQELGAFAVRDPWFLEVEDALRRCAAGQEGGEEQAAAGQKRKQGSSREHPVKAKKKKKKKAHQEEDTLLGQCPLSRSSESSPRRGSKKKPVRVDAPEYIPIGDGPKTPTKKKTKSKKKVGQPVLEEPALKKKKKKKRKESEVAGDLWEEVRRKALQEEIDRESGKTEVSETRTGTQFGQWDTAGFENEEQKLKFLKLMGGFKNLSPSFSRPPSTLGRPNMALSKQAADSLQQGLQRDYDRALSWKYSRGAGLGFAPASDKIFYIDRNASKSVRLDD
ncbi:lysine-rich nucleolar protein 1 isoform X2 [Oryctolagus cuniculus]|uniref:Lysine rich nucleolar protein 1 n=1 Tax=Oryctolagus cuniculus TaxID=9986 RepID=A0A5F9DHB0_RABIT|nr:lysine-rich nucleolar protein 1 isoform X2 [Oryctolagus cuniculus]